MKKLFFYLILIIIIISLFNYQENFTLSKQLNKLDLDKIDKIQLNLKNVETNDPLFCFDNYCLFLKNDVYSLYDKTTLLTHSRYHKDTKKCDFVYLNTILKDYPKNINNVCILGFGLGGLPLAMSENENINQIDCVDIDIRMFKLFNTINDNPPKKINYYLNDVNDYIKLTPNKYDMIVDDTYATDKIIVDYSVVKSILNPGGILFINVTRYDMVKKLTVELEKIFSDVTHQRVNFNYLITCKY